MILATPRLGAFGRVNGLSVPKGNVREFLSCVTRLPDNEGVLISPGFWHVGHFIHDMDIQGRRGLECDIPHGLLVAGAQAN